jgi:hypothetical protein
MSVLYYSRMRFIIQLLPLLLASQLPSHVISVFGPHRNDKIFPEDLSLRDPKHYGFMNMGSHVAYMTTFFFEKLVTQQPGKLSLTHYFPGIVITKTYYVNELPRRFNYLARVLIPIANLLSLTVAQMESGERTIFHASSRFPAKDSKESKPSGMEEVQIAVSSDGIVGGGAYRTNWNGETFEMPKMYLKLRKEGMSKKVWDHTMKAFEEIGAGRVFTE